MKHQVPYECIRSITCLCMQSVLIKYMVGQTSLLPSNPRGREDMESLTVTLSRVVGSFCRTPTRFSIRRCTSSLVCCDRQVA